MKKITRLFLNMQRVEH